MGNSSSVSAKQTPAIATPSAEVAKNNNGEEKPKCKACCACPETKRARDECIVQNGEENCSELIEKHKQCMRDMGFKI